MLLCTSIYLWVRSGKHLWKDRRLLDSNFRRNNFKYSDASFLSNYADTTLHMVVIPVDMHFTLYDTNLHIGSWVYGWQRTTAPLVHWYFSRIDSKSFIYNIRDSGAYQCSSLRSQVFQNGSLLPIVFWKKYLHLKKSRLLNFIY